MQFVPSYLERHGTRWQPGTNLPNLMEPLPIQSDHQRLLVAYSDMPPGKRCRLGSPNLYPKIMKFSNRLGDFLNALKQSLFTTTTTHKRHLTKPEVQCAANTCTTDLHFPTPEKYCSTKGECCKPLRQRPRLDLAELAVALKTKSLARNPETTRNDAGRAAGTPVHNTVIAIYRALRLPQLGVSGLLLYPPRSNCTGRQEEFT